MTSPAPPLQVPTPPSNSPAVKDVRDESSVDLAQGDYEVLAIVAYRQPITKAIVDEVRSVPSDDELDRQMRLEMIKPESTLAATHQSQYLRTRRLLKVMRNHYL